MSSSDSSFQEVLKLGIDQSQFSTDLASIEASWSAAVARMEEVGKGATSPLASATSADFSNLTAQLEAFTTNLGTAFSSLSNTVTETMGRAENAIQLVIDKEEQLGAATSQAGAGSGGGLFAGINEASGGMLAMVANVAEVLVLWRAVSLVVNGIVDVLKSPFTALEQGFAYLKQVQVSTDELTGVLQANVKFSADLTENFKQAGQAAESIVKALQDIAVKDNLSFANLFNSFKSLTESGGADAVGSMNELVRLTELFNLAMKASGVSMQVNRRLIAEIPLAMEGSLPPADKFLEILHMSGDAWKVMRDEGLAHHDLVSRLAPVLMPYLDAIQQASVHEAVLAETTDLLKSRWEGLIAGPVFAQYIAFLQEALAWIDKNKTLVEQWGKNLGEVFGDMLGTLKQMLSADFSPLISGFQLLAKSAVIFAAAIGTAINGVSHLAAEVSKLAPNSSPENQAVNADKTAEFNSYMAQGGDTFSTPDQQAAHKAKVAALEAKQDAILAQADALANSRIKAIEDAQKTLTDSTAKSLLLLDGSIQAPGSGTTPFDMNTPTSGTGNRVNLDAQKERKAALAQELEDYRSAYKLIEDNARKELALSKETDAETNRSAKESSAQRIEIAKNEYEQKVALIDKYSSTIKALGGSKKQFDPTDLLATADAQEEAQTASAKKAAADEAKKIARDGYNAQLTDAKKHYADMEALDKEMYARGASDSAQFMRDKIRDYEAEYQAELAILTKESTDQAVSAEQRSRSKDELAALDKAHTDKQELNSALLADATKKDSEARAENELKLSSAIEQSAARQKLAQDSLSGNKAREAQDSIAITGLKIKEVNAELVLAQAKLMAMGPLSLENEAYQKQLLVIQNLINAKQGLAAQSAKQQSDSDFFGRTYALDANGEKTGDNQSSGLDMLYKSATNLKNVFQTLSGVVGAVNQGIQKGGALGGIGAGLSAGGSAIGNNTKGIQDLLGGADSALGAAIPGIGAAMQMVGPVISMISGIFAKAAQDAADKITKAVGNIKDAFSSGQTNLIQTLNALEQQKQQAITQLSGMKGGQAQLDKLLPGLDSQIAQLQGQQKQIIDNFTNQTVIMGQFTKEGQQWLTTWQGINQQVKDFLGAGGSKDEAALFLKEQLAQQTKDITTQYDAAEQQAIKDTIGLNDLLTQRQRLLDQINNISASLNDSVQRREAGAIVAGKTARDQKTALQEQLAAMDEQIAVQTKTVAAEKALFGLTSNIADLHRLDEQLSLVALQNQIAEWTKLQQLMKSLTGTPIVPSNQTGMFAGTSPFSGIPGGIPGEGATTNIVVNVVAGSDPEATGRAIATTIEQELDYRYRSKGQ